MKLKQILKQWIGENREDRIGLLLGLLGILLFTGWFIFDTNMGLQPDSPEGLKLFIRHLGGLI